jgi:hypothetical protein
MSGIEDGLKMTGRLQIFRNDELVHDIDNLVVTVGKNFVASRIVGTTPAVMSHMAVGTGAVAAAAGDTALGAELARVALSGNSAANNVVSYSANFPAGTGTGALTEAGVFNAGAAGTLFCRTVFAAVNKGASDAITINWTVTVN